MFCNNWGCQLVGWQCQMQQSAVHVQLKQRGYKKQPLGCSIPPHAVDLRVPTTNHTKSALQTNKIDVLCLLHNHIINDSI